MTFDQQTNAYSATISGTGTQAGDVIDFYVRAEVTDQSKRYTCFPTQAQFDFTTGVEERDFFSVVVTASARIVALSNDLQLDPDWTISSANTWVHGAPPFTHKSEQPAFDYPYDDDTAPTPSPNCYYTGLNGPVTGTWKLTTETFDLTGADVGTISYALWFYARVATDETHKLQAKIYDGTGWTLLETIDVAGGTARVRWIRRRVKIPSNVNLTSAMKLRFIAIGDTGLPLRAAEACIDEVRVWGLHN